MANLVFTVASGSTIPTTSQSTITFDFSNEKAGYTDAVFTLSTALPVGEFVNSQPGRRKYFVVSSTNSSITGITPASADIEGDGHVGHGAMIDPYLGSQGFDSYIGAGTVSVTAGNVAYSASLNKDPAIGGAITINQGDEFTVVKSIRLASVTNANQWQTVQSYAELHVLSEAPPVGSYAPSSSETGQKTILVQRANTDLNVFGGASGIDLSGAWTPDYATIEAKIPPNLGHYGRTGESLRRFRLDDDYTGGISNYSVPAGENYSRFLTYASDSRCSAANRRQIADWAIDAAIQIYGLMGRGWGPSFAGPLNGAGQQGAIVGVALVGAMASQNQTVLDTLKTLKAYINSSMWIDSGTNLRDVSYNSTYRYAQFMLPDLDGFPIVVPDEDFGGNLDSRYGPLAAKVIGFDYLPVLPLTGGPSGESGQDIILAGASLNVAGGQNAAHLSFIDRTRFHTPWYSASSDPGNDWRNLYDDLRTGTKWVGPRPDQLHFLSNPFTGGSGSVSWNISSYDYTAGTTPTQTDFRYSLDGYQWIEALNVGDSGSVSGLLTSVTHYGSLRRQSSGGAGAWSTNVEYADFVADKNLFTTTGTAGASTPTITVNPAIVQKISHGTSSAPQTVGNWEPLAANALSKNGPPVVAAGVGYWSGSLPTSYTYSWDVSADGSTVETAAVASTKELNVLSYAGKYVRVTVTGTNANGSDSHTTAWAQVPSAAALASTKLINTDFRAAAAWDYAAQIAAMTSSNASPTHRPFGSYCESKQYAAYHQDEQGYIDLRKTGSWPSMRFPLKNSAVAGTTYNVTIKVQTVSTNLASLSVGVINAGNSQVLDGGARTVSVPASGGEVSTITGTITVAGGETDLDFRINMQVNTATGGTAGGYARLVSAVIEAAP